MFSLISGWLGFGGVIFAVSHVIYSSIGPGDTPSFSPPAAIPPFQAPDQEPRKPPELLSVPKHSPAVPLQPAQGEVMGSDKEAVEYVNMCKEFIDKENIVKKDLLNSWLQKLNEFTIKSAVDVSPVSVYSFFAYKDVILVKSDTDLYLNISLLP